MTFWLSFTKKGPRSVQVDRVELSARLIAPMLSGSALAVLNM